MAGKVRYLDSRPDEQLRGITMESSAVSLYFRVLKKNKEDPNSEPEIREHLINLIDSPGHIDFSSEVSTASRLCDGAVILVDVVEGVCSQTITVLRQSWVDNLKPILVLNKIDRLITELKLTPAEAYLHLSKVIEQVNSIIGSFFAGERMQENLLWREKLEKSLNQDEEYIEKDDQDIYFSPEKNNVIFASAIDGWGFNISQFSAFYEKKLGMKRENLQKVLWGDYYLDPKTKKIITSKGLKGRSLKPLFVSFVLDNIWTVYENALINKNLEKLEKIIQSLNLKISQRDLKSRDTKYLLQSIFGQWLPVSTAVLITIIEKLPSPLESQKSRIPTILNTAPGSELINEDLKQAMLACDRNGLTSAYVSKMVSIPESELPKNQTVALTADEMIERGRAARAAAAKAAEAARKFQEENSKKDDFEIVDSNNNFDDPFGEDIFETEEEDQEEEEAELAKEVLIGYARVYSGCLKVGSELTVLGPKYDPLRPNEHIHKVTISELYLLMGRELIALKEVPAGNIVGIGGLAGKVLKNGTLISPDITGVNLAGITLNAPPIVKVALEPVNPTQMDKLEKGLQLLNAADPCAQTFLQDTGEHILATAGELHLERCLKDLRERFAGIEISVSNPLIPYRETIVSKPEMNPPKFPELGRGCSELKIANISILFKVRPLPNSVTDFLIENQNTIHSLINKVVKAKSEENSNLESGDEDSDVVDDGVGINPVIAATDFKKKLQELFSQATNENKKDPFNWDGYVDKITSFGPKRTGPNILFDLKEHTLRRIFASSNTKNFEFEDSILNGFQLATYEGPLAQEFVQGIAVFVEKIEVIKDEDSEQKDEFKNLAGRILTSTRDCIHRGFLDWSPRLMLAMYTCDIQTSAEVLGKVYAVVQKRRGHIMSEEMKEGTPFFTIEARIPVVEAFGFSEDIRKKTSGAASPQLVFAGYEIIDEDPFWVPTTVEELEELGEIADKANIARKYMNAIRKRKGLFVDEKVIQNAEKQRTLKKD
ncbi:hypothetical protein PACTADRAFT_48729 [Pachysolen tannophilus NRRL Y-2460]|uniref:Ribosome assembly protein 1 n=1 Tax=Pachysolen tannophilus NRRL Y-2460 TaxID=669874 RepID=A0A1E4TYW9_PACTA|nr:hypothetical protein PACTADRAFT_48729 [Pachysolen tannophilus NRRL Y-2460]